MSNSDFIGGDRTKAGCRPESLRSAAPTLTERRVAAGQCPQCGKEAAPFRLCYGCRQTRRIVTACKGLEKQGIIKVDRSGRSHTFQAIPGTEKLKPDERWSTPIVPPDDDLRFKPRVRGIRVDVERTILQVMKVIGRPCTTEEIYAGWGRLRAKRTAPLANDLARIIAAEDKRKRRATKSTAPMTVGTSPADKAPSVKSI